MRSTPILSHAPAALGWPLLLWALATSVACGGSSPEEVRQTVASGAVIRGSIGEEGVRSVRLAPDGPLTVSDEGLARLVLDSGPRVLLAHGASAAVTADSVLQLSDGRAFVQVGAGAPLDVVLVSGELGSSDEDGASANEGSSTGGTTIRLTDAAVSIDLTAAGGTIYVVRGEARVGQGSAGTAVQTGERLALTAGSEPEPAALWEDWTGGLAEPGPAGAAAAGVGTLEARVPGALGRARWPLVIRRLDVRVRVEGDLAITDVEQVFFNPASETVEGLYRIRVPEGSVLQRFAVDRNGRLVDGYVKEKAQARRQYQRQVYRGSTLDPALLEWDAPGRYRARIYPIQPGATRRIAIRYVEWLRRPGSASGDAPRLYRFPMGVGVASDAPVIQAFSFVGDLSEAHAGGIRAGHGAAVEDGRVVLRRTDFSPASDLVLELTDDPDDEDYAPGHRATRAEHVSPPRDPQAGAVPDEDDRDYWHVPLVLPASVFGEPSDGVDLVLVADISAATEATHLELGRSVIESLAAHLGPNDRVAIIASDLTLRPVRDGDAELGAATPERVDALLDGLARIPQGGATDLGATLSAAAALLDPARPGAVVYVGDGAPTVGELEAEGLLEALSRLPRPLRAYAVAVGADAELELLEGVTRGGGLTRRVLSRSAAAETALEIMAHARRPVAQRVTVEVTGVDQLFPRAPVDVTQGEALTIVGRLDEDASSPSSVTVRGVVAGDAFEERFDVVTSELDDRGDLRLRWAAERLQQLLRTGNGRQEIADLGTRFGLITPFTSFYVPSAAELSHLGPRALELYEDERLAMLVHGDTRAPASVASAMLAPLALSGCSFGSDEAASPGPEAVPEAPMMDEEGEEDSWNAAPRQEARTATAEQQAQPAPVSAAPSDDAPAEPEPEPEMASERNAPAPPPGAAQAERRLLEALAGADESERSASDTSQVVTGEEQDALGAALDRSGVGDSFGMGGLGMRGSGRTGGEGGSAGGRRAEHGFRDNAFGNSPRGSQMSAARPRNRAATARRSRRPSGAPSTTTPMRPTRDQDREDTGDGDGNEGLGDLDITITTRVQIRPTERHTVRQCSDASRQSFEDRRELFRERLQGASGPHAWLRLYRQAIRHCEAPSFRDRRALMQLMLSRAGSVRGMIGLYHASRSAGMRRYFRRAILRRVRSPEDLRLARAAFGASVDQDFIDRQLAAATTDARKIRTLRRLVAQFPSHMDLQLQLLQLLERTGHNAEARRLGYRMRDNALADAGVRTALGEMYLRLEDEAEARRVFSEIVEFSPRDETARRRLGDLYRAHGWFDEAYRQYQTLTHLRPDDPSVNLLMAQAAAGAGRVDEALRLEQALARTGQPGQAVGMARTALLWSSVRFAQLRSSAREAGGTEGQETLDALTARMRRSGVMSQTAPLRASLTWSHPDSTLGLYASYPGLGLTRPMDLSPEFGIEVFDVQELQDGRYRFEVRRGGQDHLGPAEGMLTIVFHEGLPDEQIRVFPIRLEPGTTTARFEAVVASGAVTSIEQGGQ